MRLEGTYFFDAPVQEVWDALMDPVVLAAVMPGCEKLDLVDGRYQGELTIKVGPIQGNFSGIVELKDVDAPKSYAMVVDGRGPHGFMKATAKVRLEADGEQTKMAYDADAQVGGKLATVGQRLIDASAKAIVKQALEGLHENIKVRHRYAKEQAEEASVPTAAPVADEAKPEAKLESPDVAGEPPPAPVAAPPPAAPPAPEPARPAVAPVIKVDQKAFVSNVAKEVSKSMAPRVALYVGVLVGVGVVLWLLLRP